MLLARDHATGGTDLSREHLRTADGVLSTFLVSWLGKESMAGVGLADSFNMVIMAFFAAVDLGTTVVVAFSLGTRDRKRARAAASVAGINDRAGGAAGGWDPFGRATDH